VDTTTKPAEIQLLEAMKISPMSLSLAGMAAALATGLLPAAEPAMRDVATHEQLSERLRVANNQSPLVDHTPAEGKDPTKVASASLVSRSDFMSYAGRATLVPKRAILHIPAAMADRIKLQPGSKIQTWAEFYAMNRGWVTTVEVTRAQAEGNQALAEELLKRIQKSSQVVVATYQGGPISVLPLKVPVETTATPKP
jgi:hypothetical protein